MNRRGFLKGLLGSAAGAAAVAAIPAKAELPEPAPPLGDWWNIDSDPEIWYFSGTTMTGASLTGSTIPAPIIAGSP